MPGVALDLTVHGFEVFLLSPPEYEASGGPPPRADLGACMVDAGDQRAGETKSAWPLSLCRQCLLGETGLKRAGTCPRSLWVLTGALSSPSRQMSKTGSESSKQGNLALR